MFDPDPGLNALLQSLLHPGLKTIEPGLERVLHLLEQLGNPHLNLPPVVHVAGTNGKGSTLAFLKAMLQAAGYRVHRYTSPHLVHFNERIELDSTPIAKSVLVPLLEQIRALHDIAPSTFFEATTVAAFMAFAEHPADIVLLETGMGGRLDATNVIDKPALTIITPIGMDHAQYLGNTLTEIAAEKAAILKPGVPAVIAPQRKEAAEVIAQVAADMGVRPITAAHWRLRLQADGGFSFNLHDYAMQCPAPGLSGLHQYHNAATAMVASAMLPLVVTDAHRMAGISSARWPARLQVLSGGYWASLLPRGVTLTVDGGHNPMAAQALGQWCEGRRVRAVVGMLKDKDAAGFFEALCGKVEKMATVTIPGEDNVASAEHLAMLAKTAGLDVDPAASIENALSAVSRDFNGDVLVCGSLYLAGAMLAKN